MKKMTLQTIAQCTQGSLVLPRGYKGDLDKEIQGVVNDNRQVQEDFLFVPMVGARVDGHSFIEDAFSKGAFATLSEKTLDKPKGPYIKVADTKLALKQIATYYRMQLIIPVIGVIGSVGKTSTKEMLASVLGTKFKVLKTEGNFNNEIGLPLTICRITDEHDVAVVEMGISDFGEMHRLGQIAKPNYVVMTNIGQCHLENLKDRDGILRAKTEVFDHMPSTGTVVLNGDDDKLRDCDTKNLKKISYGLSDEDVHASNIKTQITSTCADISIGKDTFSVEIPLPGEHNVMNALAASAVGKALGLTLDEIRMGLENAGTISGRNNVIKLEAATIIDDCYNANPVSMKASIEVLAKAKGRTIAVLGDMGELGDDEKALHYGLGKVLADNNIDMLYTTGELSMEINKALEKENPKAVNFHFENKEKLLEALLPAIEKGDTILVKASHFMQYSEIVNALSEKLK